MLLLRPRRGGYRRRVLRSKQAGTAIRAYGAGGRWRTGLDEPVGMLGDITPRAAVRTAAGRGRVAGWLKHLENRSSSQLDRNDPMATYDFTWMWRELGIESLRK